jgi:hypothetical protein
MRLLFILKKRQVSGGSCPEDSNSCSSGLLNSAKFVVDMLNNAGVDALLEEAIDNNCIDRLVTEHKPSHVIIEALWVVPEKFEVLKKLHPRVTWIVRLHSDIPFLAGEGIAIDWIFGYLKRGIKVAFNSPRIARDIREVAAENVLYLPNYYPVEARKNCAGNMFRVGCFGAIRPMKNQLLQAIAAIRFANETGRPLEFWINASRCEESGNNVLKNLRSLFANTEYKLIELPWLTHDAFLSIMSLMNVSLCDSFSETFCITAADAVNTGTPLICSKEVPWASPFSIVDTTDSDSIVRKLYLMSSPAGKVVSWINRRNLQKYSERSQDIWLEEF